MINQLTLEQKVGALFSMSFWGSEITPEIKQHFIEHHIANYVLFAENLKDYRSIAALTNELQQIAREAAGIPAFISADQEGGMVARLFSGATHFPSNMAITAAGMNDQTETIGRMVGEELRALGINLNHAPCMDVNNNPLNPVIGIRSYSDDPNVVAESGSGYIRGLQSSGCIAQAKHFPGHGNTHVDSHLGLPTVESTLDELEQMELIPFRRAIEAGVDSIMTAHILYPKLEPDNVPATMSKRILSGLLREELGFEGLIMTDSMSMDAIQKFYGIENGCIAAIAAGADIICIRADYDVQQRAYKAVLAAAQDGRIPLSRIDDAILRQLALKEKYAICFNDVTSGTLTECYPEHEALASQISAGSITVLRDRCGLLPITGKKVFAVSPPPVTANIADDTIVTQVSFARYLAEKIGGDYEIISFDPEPEEIARVVQSTAGHDVLVLGSYNAAFSQGQQQLARTLLDTGIPTVCVALRVPYDAAYMPDSITALLAYEYTNRSVQNAAAVLFGQNAVGQIPVSVKTKTKGSS